MIQVNVAVRKSRAGFVAVAALACALIALIAIPALAAADTFEVNSHEDTATKAGCESSVTTDECTLRGAVEAVNADPTPTNSDTIDLLLDPFDGSSGGEIQLGSALSITHTVTIAGPSSCVLGLDLLPKPCAGLIAHPGEPALSVQAPGVTIENIAFGGGTAGVEVLNEAFKARGDWFGLDLEGNPKRIGAAGIFLSEGADGSVIGGDEDSSRNVFSSSEAGIRLSGASGSKIEGNYIGVAPDGTTIGAVTIGVYIADGPSVGSHGNVIGGELTEAEASSPACDGPCNTIVTDHISSDGIVLAGKFGDTAHAASGPTTISGNYIGLSADGKSQLGIGEAGIYAGPTEAQPDGPGEVTVGGPPGAFGANQNVIDGDEVGVFVENAESFLAEANAFGYLPGTPGSDDSGPEEAAFSLFTEGVTDRPEITQNGMTLGPDAIGVKSDGEGSRIIDNSTTRGLVGIWTLGDDSGGGNLVKNNQILKNADQEGPDRFGILIENDSNIVTGNTILGAGWGGIATTGDNPDYAAHNRIGGDGSGEANRIEGSGEGAIQLGGLPTTHNEVAGNFGAGNGGPFIEFQGHEGPHPPNGEIQPPTLEVVEQSKVSGAAKPGAKVRIFSKSSIDVGELGALIGAATAASNGHWTAPIPKLNVGDLVAATQTTAAETAEGATSEVSTPKAAVADQEEKGGSGSGSGGGGSSGGGSGAGGSGSSTMSPPPPPKATAPKVKITKGPKKSSTSTKATFKFTATPAAGATFECKLDNGKWAKCKSPKTYKKLKPKKHTFRVRASAAGLTGPVAKFQFTVKS